MYILHSTNPRFLGFWGCEPTFLANSGLGVVRQLSCTLAFAKGDYHQREINYNLRVINYFSIHVCLKAFII